MFTPGRSWETRGQLATCACATTPKGWSKELRGCEGDVGAKIGPHVLFKKNNPGNSTSYANILLSAQIEGRPIRRAWEVVRTWGRCMTASCGLPTGVSDTSFFPRIVSLCSCSDG